MQKNTKQSNEQQSFITVNQRTLENILDEYKVLSLQLFEQAGVVSESDTENALLSVKQAKLLDRQQELLIEAQSLKLKNDKDIITLLQLWKSEEVYNDDVTPSQGLVLHLLKRLEHALV